MVYCPLWGRLSQGQVGVLTLVPLLKIDEICAQLRGSGICSAFDVRGGCYHVVLSGESGPKSAFVSSFGEWEFKGYPFGLAQAPAYFQRLVNDVLSGLTFAFGYLDDILVLIQTWNHIWNI